MTCKLRPPALPFDLAVPFHRLGVILRDALAAFVHNAEVELGPSITLLGRPWPVPFHRLGIILGTPWPRSYMTPRLF